MSITFCEGPFNHSSGLQGPAHYNALPLTQAPFKGQGKFPQTQREEPLTGEHGRAIPSFRRRLGAQIFAKWADMMRL